MLKQPDPTLHKTTRTEITALFGDAKLVLDETPKVISPFGGLASFISCLGQIGFARQVQTPLPFAEATSNNAIPLAHSLTAFLMSVVVGAQRFAHCEGLRADRVLHALLGLERFPSDDTIRNFFLRFWVTNRSEAALELWRDYNGRACGEQRIEELKHDLAADGFCLQPFFATEAAFLAVLFTFNPLSLYQHQTTPTAPYRQPGTLRVAVFLCGAVLGVLGRDLGVKLSAAWGGLRKHKPLVDATLAWLKGASPKLIPPEDRLPIGGGLI